MTNKELYYFNKAKEASKLSDFNKIHIGCIVAYKNNIIAKGYNTNKTNPLQKMYNHYRNLEWVNGVQPVPKLHAELMCILKIMHLDIDFSKVKLYVYRQDLKGNLAMCRPCKACMKAIKNLGIKNIYYTTNDGYSHEVIL